MYWIDTKDGHQRMFIIAIVFFNIIALFAYLAAAVLLAVAPLTIVRVAVGPLGQAALLLALAPRSLKVRAVRAVPVAIAAALALGPRALVQAPRRLVLIVFLCHHLHSISVRSE
jgi:hypothetical protein